MYFKLVTHNRKKYYFDLNTGDNYDDCRCTYDVYREDFCLAKALQEDKTCELLLKELRDTDIVNCVSYTGDINEWSGASMKQHSERCLADYNRHKIDFENERPCGLKG